MAQAHTRPPGVRKVPIHPRAYDHVQGTRCALAHKYVQGYGSSKPLESDACSYEYAGEETLKDDVFINISILLLLTERDFVP